MLDQIYHLPNISVRRALISVSNKTGIIELAQSLHQRKVEIISTGGTAKVLRNAGIPVTDVSEITRFPECLDGRVKTLHPMIHGALLARPALKEHADTLSNLGIEPIQLVVVNLYPFEEAVLSRPDDLEHAVENIDIGGPTMVRAAAKNFENVCILTSPDQYSPFLTELEKTNNAIRAVIRAQWALIAFRHTASYDRYISEYLENKALKDHSITDTGRIGTDRGYSGFEPQITGNDTQPSVTSESLSLRTTLFQSLRYGENPHQQAAVYGDPSVFIDCFHGKAMSYNNYLDADAALQLAIDFQDTDKALCSIFKHTVPCGVALAESTEKAWQKALNTDTVSPFGGIILFNRSVDLQTARAVDDIFSEMILAPGFDRDALKLLKKKSSRRLIKVKKLPDQEISQIRSILGGYLSQQPDKGFSKETRKIVTKIQPDADQLRSLEFAWKIAKHVKSNAIVYVKGEQTIGIGTGQPNRVDSSRIAVQKAHQFGHSTDGSVVASDAFFPFPDGIEEAARSGAIAVIQPGGSVRDDEVVNTADRFGMAMIFTGTRHFRH
ncbi:MAG: bifunctional phosphoribosylaminoimidazolecarboxamide formyltransferase/IMP cyclohydrolase [Balneolales bacterium]